MATEKVIDFGEIKAELIKAYNDREQYKKVILTDTMTQLMML